MSDVKISALPVGVATSSTPFPAIVGGVTDQVTLAPIYTGLDGKAALVHTHASTDLVSGTVATARLGSGTATSTTYLSGGQSYNDLASITVHSFFPGVSVTPLVQSSWAWVNQSSASVVQGANTVFLGSTAVAAGIFARVIAAPATPYTITAMLRGWYTSLAVDQQWMGIIFRDLGGKLMLTHIQASNQYQVSKYTSPTVFNSAPLAISLAAAGDYHWLRIADDGTNLKFFVSLDGINFNLSYSETRGTWFSTAPGPEQVGIFGVNAGGTERIGASYFSWVVSTS